ncbi:hypothetical protein [Mycobacterium sp. URHB0044]|jgi:hypothetical protein|uniref:hypothetical protein n=1 Tax=Mycobacterium sp. URHB0044 TaxID=1380386 RepID=UPI000684DCFE|nr:hypothetical protein [Mycobacterium sp. URHB0044]
MIARSAFRRAAVEAFEPLTLRLLQWSVVGLFRRNPLLRASDRFEVVVVALAVMVSLLVVPIAAAVGTAVHDSRRDVYTQQGDTPHLVTPAITDDNLLHISSPGPSSGARQITARNGLMKRLTRRLWGQRLRFRRIGVDSMTLVRLAARRSLMDSAGFRRVLPGDLSAIVAP